MKKIVLFLSALYGVVACNAPAKPEVSAPATSTDNAKILIAYFSHSGENYGVGNIREGNTQKVAQEIARQTNGTLFRIQTVQKYPADYKACSKQAQEEKEKNARPELTATVENMDAYDVVYIGYPIWWGDMPMAVYTFLDSYSWDGKNVYPFATHEGSGLADTVNSLKKALPRANVKDGLELKGHVAQKEPEIVQRAVRHWLTE